MAFGDGVRWFGIATAPRHTTCTKTRRTTTVAVMVAVMVTVTVVASSASCARALFGVTRASRRLTFDVRRSAFDSTSPSSSSLSCSRAPLRYLCEWACATDARKRGGARRGCVDVYAIALSKDGSRVGSYDGKHVVRHHTENQ